MTTGRHHAYITLPHLTAIILFGRIAAEHCDTAVEFSAAIMNDIGSSTTPEMEKTVTDQITDDVVRLLERSREDLEHYRRELGKDKAEVGRHIRELRMELMSSITEMRKVFSESKDLTIETARRLMDRVDELEKQIKTLTEPEAERLRSRLIAIRKALRDILIEMAGTGPFPMAMVVMGDKLHRLRIKADILRLRMQLGKMNLRDAVFESRKTLRDRVRRIRSYAQDSEESLEKRLRAFRKEVHDAYEHMNKAFTIK